MDPLVAELADLADAELQWTLIPEQRDAALRQAFEVVLGRIEEERGRLAARPAASTRERSAIDCLWRQARATMEEIREAQFAHPVPAAAMPAKPPPRSKTDSNERPCPSTC
jgi:hypothetical protein